ncbi:MAG: hypothetical protein K2L42_04905 [Clostridia bacterium]|nr:hypothetical protein [Clostridia bacterium]
MKYLRKITVAVIAFIFFVAVSIGAGVMFAIRNVNVTYYDYGSGNDGTISEIKKTVLDNFRGTLIAFVNEEDIKLCIPNGYVLTKFEKAYPCTLNFTVKERVEVFAENTAAGYDIYDEDGEFLRSSESYFNGKDGAPNIIIESDDKEAVANAAASFKRNFNSLRSSVEKISVKYPQTSFDDHKYAFYLRCGLIIEVKGVELFEEKLARAAEVFATLSGEQKLGGTIYCYTAIDGVSVRATYENAA